MATLNGNSSNLKIESTNSINNNERISSLTNLSGPSSSSSSSSTSSKSSLTSLISSPSSSHSTLSTLLTRALTDSIVQRPSSLMNYCEMSVNDFRQNQSISFPSFDSIKTLRSHSLDPYTDQNETNESSNCNLIIQVSDDALIPSSSTQSTSSTNHVLSAVPEYSDRYYTPDETLTFHQTATNNFDHQSVSDQIVSIDDRIAEESTSILVDLEPMMISSHVHDVQSSSSCSPSSTLYASTTSSFSTSIMSNVNTVVQSLNLANSDLPHYEAIPFNVNPQSINRFDSLYGRSGIDVIWYVI